MSSILQLSELIKYKCMIKIISFSTSGKDNRGSGGFQMHIPNAGGITVGFNNASICKQEIICVREKWLNFNGLDQKKPCLPKHFDLDHFSFNVLLYCSPKKYFNYQQSFNRKVVWIWQLAKLRLYLLKKIKQYNAFYQQLNTNTWHWCKTIFCVFWFSMCALCECEEFQIIFF